MILAGISLRLLEAKHPKHEWNYWNKTKQGLSNAKPISCMIFSLAQPCTASYLPDLEVVVLVLRGGRRDGGDAEQDVRVGLGQPVHDVSALGRLDLIALVGEIGGEGVLAPAHLRPESPT